MFGSRHGIAFQLSRAPKPVAKAIDFVTLIAMTGSRLFSMTPPGRTSFFACP